MSSLRQCEKSGSDISLCGLIVFFLGEVPLFRCYEFLLHTRVFVILVSVVSTFFRVAYPKSNVRLYSIRSSWLAHQSSNHTSNTLSLYPEKDYLLMVSLGASPMPDAGKCLSARFRLLA
jgi:hypothetical protein